MFLGCLYEIAESVFIWWELMEVFRVLDDDIENFVALIVVLLRPVADFLEGLYILAEGIEQRLIPREKAVHQYVNFHFVHNHVLLQPEFNNISGFFKREHRPFSEKVGVERDGNHPHELGHQQSDRDACTC
jgi:hypothetical protein